MTVSRHKHSEVHQIMHVCCIRPPTTLWCQVTAPAGEGKYSPNLIQMEKSSLEELILPNIKLEIGHFLGEFRDQAMIFSQLCPSHLCNAWFVLNEALKLFLRFYWSMLLGQLMLINCVPFSPRSLWGISSMLYMSSLCECRPFWQTARTWGEVGLLQMTSSWTIWVSFFDGYVGSLGKMTCWTWPPCFRRTPGWDARSTSPESWMESSSHCPKSPGTSMWMGMCPNLTEKRPRWWWRGGLMENNVGSLRCPWSDGLWPWRDTLRG